MAEASKLSYPVYAPARKASPGVVGVLLETHAVPREEGPRKLVRPRIPEQLAVPVAPRRLRGAAPLTLHGTGTTRSGLANGVAVGQAEALYLRKQMEAHTAMVFVLEDGERVEGVVEWFDRDSIKVRGAARMLLFKRGIKCLYKAGVEGQV